jgi:D-alanyl-D-alanine carboxypeptidase (penicillin-binding protein 5/6)
MPGPLLLDPRAPVDRRRRRRVIGALAVLVLLVAAGVAQLERGVAGAKVAVVLTRFSVVPGTAIRMPWPTDATAAVSVEGVANLGGERGDVVRPLASVTKLITALVVLRQHPLGAGQSGPTIRFTASDAIAYRQDLAQGQSVLKVSAGERLTELQALEGMLIPSADNVARTVARWSAGNSSAFVTDMNQEAARLGLRRTHLVEPSGLDPGSVGTAADMVRVGAAVMADPVLRQIVAMPSVTLPVAGTVDNYDSVLGQDGIIGIKTGSMSAAGGNFVFAARHRIGGRTVTIIGAVLGAGGTEPLQTALDEATRLVTTAAAAVRRVVLLPPRRRVLAVTSAWGPRVQALTTRAATLLAVPGQRLTMRVTVAPQFAERRFHELKEGERMATVDIRYNGQNLELPVRAAAKLPPPSFFYELTRL